MTTDELLESLHFYPISPNVQVVVQLSGRLHVIGEVGAYDADRGLLILKASSSAVINNPTPPEET